MKTMTSISGGQTSAYLAANHPTDYNIFALVTTDDKNCIYPDKKLRQIVSDKIGREFIGTLEDDIIIHTIMDLEQYMGRKIDWVAGESFDNILNKEKHLPNYKYRFCTEKMKVKPIFEWWLNNIKQPIQMNIGYRLNEKKRADFMQSNLNDNGLLEQKYVIGKHKSGRNKWGTIEWQKPNFPLIENFIERIDVQKYWKDKPVRFAESNNCIGCFFRSASILNKMSKLHPEKFDWFIEQERKVNEIVKKRKGIKDDIMSFKTHYKYDKIKEMNFTMSIPFDYDTEGCDSGYCGL